MTSRPSLTGRVLARSVTVSAALLLLACPLARAEDGKQKPRGSTYTNRTMGITAQGPAGWRMVADKTTAPTRWVRLVTFNDKTTDAQAVLSARTRSSPTLDEFHARVRQDWEASSDRLRVSSMRKVEPAPGRSVGSVVVDGTFVRKPKRKKAAADAPPPPPAPPVTYRVQATYYLAAGYEFLLYAQGQQTHWSRLRMPLNNLRDSMKFHRVAPKGPKGEGSYRDDRRGFSCRFPPNYTVVVPQRGNHLVQFEGVGEDDPGLGVYRLRWGESIERDADRLIAYYEDDLAGEANMRRIEVGGKEAMLVTARATISGRDRVFLLALVKRGDDELFRVRASMPAGAETSGGVVFRKFLNGFQLGPAPK